MRIYKYFSSKGGSKQKPSSSDLDTSGEDSDKKQERKNSRQFSESIEEDMALQETLCEMKATMSKLATREDVQQIREYVEKLCGALTTRDEQLESSVFDLQKENDKLKSDIVKIQEENAEMRGQLSQCLKEKASIKRDMNDYEQHGRQWNLRVFGVREGKREETVQDCVTKCVDIFSQKLGVTVSPNDIEIAHWSGKPAAAGSRPRPILIRFFSRRLRGQVLAARKKLKQSGIAISEDLTLINYKLLKTVKCP